MSNEFLATIAFIAFASFIIWNVYEIILTHLFYKKMTKQHKMLIEKIANEYASEILGEKNEDNE